MMKGWIVCCFLIHVIYASAISAPYCTFATISSSSESSVTKDGITYHFDKAYTVGQYITGDYWVVGPVTIASIDPPTANGLSGFMINPKPGQEQALDNRGDLYNAALLPTLPVHVAVNSSVIKIVSLPTPQSGLHVLTLNTSVLSVISGVPQDNGASTFRPAYGAPDQGSFSLNDVDWTSLPNLSLKITTDPPAWGPLIAQLRIPLLDFLPNYNTGQFMPSYNGIFNYGAVIQGTTTTAVTRSMFEDVDASAESICAFALTIQYGIDIAYNLEAGNGWPANGGWGNGRKLPATFAAVVLGSAYLSSVIQSAGPLSFGEDDNGTLWEGKNGVIWGDTGCEKYQGGLEEGYWKMITAPVANGGQDYHGGCLDPYYFIDGGQWPGTKYQGCCTSQPFKDEAVPLMFMPSLQKVMNVPLMFEYAHRWESLGVRTLPDPCAPATGTCAGGSNNGKPCSTAEVDATGGPCRAGGGFCSFDTSLLGINFGPDGKGGCIAGGGRFPLLQGFEKNGGLYPIPWMDQLWPIANGSSVFSVLPKQKAIIV